MSTPTWVRFSSVVSTIESIIEKMADLLQEHDFRLREVARLAWNSDQSKLEFDDSTIIKVSSERKALSIAREWDGFALSYNVVSINASMYLYFWNKQGATCLAVQTDTQIPWYESEELAEGEWLERFFCAYTASCRASVCAYGDYYPIKYESLNQERILSELRAGSLLKRPLQSFYMISTELMTPKEMMSILKSHLKDPYLHYFQTTTGYHVLSSITLPP